MEQSTITTHSTWPGCTGKPRPVRNHKTVGKRKWLKQITHTYFKFPNRYTCGFPSQTNHRLFATTIYTKTVWYYPSNPQWLFVDLKCSRTVRRYRMLTFRKMCMWWTVDRVKGMTVVKSGQGWLTSVAIVKGRGKMVLCVEGWDMWLWWWRWMESDSWDGAARRWAEWGIRHDTTFDGSRVKVTLSFSFCVIIMVLVRGVVGTLLI